MPTIQDTIRTEVPAREIRRGDFLSYSTSQSPAQVVNVVTPDDGDTAVWLDGFYWPITVMRFEKVYVHRAKEA